MSEKITAIYMRVSTNQQSTRSQEPDLQRWVNAQELNGRVKWFSDTATGKNMNRPAWQKLQASIERGEVECVVCWRLDRLGRTASGLCQLFEDLQARKVRLISLRDSIDLGTATGRLMANMLASIAAYETELRGERVRAGQQAAQDQGKRWGGSRKGRLVGLTQQQVKTIVRLSHEGERPVNIAKAVGVNRSSVYRILQRVAEGHLTL